MKLVLVAALALLVGVFVGGMAPRGDVRRLKQELSEAHAKADQARTSSVAPIALGALFAARDRAESRAVPVAPAPGAAPSPDGTAAPAPPADEPDAGAHDGGARRGLRGLSDDKTFAAAKAAADLRAAQFKSAFVEEARMGGDKEAKLDGVIKQMNQDFAAEADKIADLVAEKGDKLTPRDVADVGVKLLSVYQHADDGLKGFLSPADQEAADKTRFDLLTQIDVASFKKLADAAAKLDHPPARLR